MTFVRRGELFIGFSGVKISFKTSSILNNQSFSGIPSEEFFPSFGTRNNILEFVRILRKHPVDAGITAWGEDLHHLSEYNGFHTDFTTQYGWPLNVEVKDTL